jgi:hypothetical protein
MAITAGTRQNITGTTTNITAVFIVHTANAVTNAGIAAITGTGDTSGFTMGPVLPWISTGAIRIAVRSWCMSGIPAPGAVTDRV